MAPFLTGAFVTFLLKSWKLTSKLEPFDPSFVGEIQAAYLVAKSCVNSV